MLVGFIHQTEKVKRLFSLIMCFSNSFALLDKRDYAIFTYAIKYVSCFGVQQQIVTRRIKHHTKAQVLYCFQKDYKMLSCAAVLLQFVLQALMCD